MYSGGSPYYQAVATLNPGDNAQKTSFFCLRNSHWQFQAMDTGLHDRDPFEAAAHLTYLEPAEIDWHREQLRTAGDRKVVLLSHHQPFSAFEAVGKDANDKDIFVNHNLLAAFNGSASNPPGENYLPKIALWLFGHEHNTVIYEPNNEVQKARCAGSSAIPANIADGNPYKPLDTSIKWKDTKKLAITNGIYNHGYAIMDIDGSQGLIRYFQYPFPAGEEELDQDVFP